MSAEVGRQYHLIKAVEFPKDRPNIEANCIDVMFIFVCGTAFVLEDSPTSEAECLKLIGALASYDPNDRKYLRIHFRK